MAKNRSWSRFHWDRSSGYYVSNLRSPWRHLAVHPVEGGKWVIGWDGDIGHGFGTITGFESREEAESFAVKYRDRPQFYQKRATKEEVTFWDS